MIIYNPINDTYNVWSTILDEFVAEDLSVDDVTEMYVQEVKDEYEQKLQNIKRTTPETCERLKIGEKPYFQFTMTYDECIRVQNSIITDEDEVEYIPNKNDLHKYLESKFKIEFPKTEEHILFLNDNTIYKIKLNNFKQRYIFNDEEICLDVLVSRIENMLKERTND